MNTYNITYEIITPESAENGDCEETGFIAEHVTSLRAAIEHLGYGAGGVEANCYPVHGATWITAYRVNEGTREYYETGTEENRSLHLDAAITNASRTRIMRLLGVYGANHPY